MSTKRNPECQGCGAPLLLTRHDCEYCRRPHEVAPPSGRYEFGCAANPRDIYGEGVQVQNQMASMNSVGQAHANQYNSQNAAFGMFGGLYGTF